MAKNILLLCSAGVSASLMVSKMQAEAQNRGIDLHIWAVPISEAEGELPKADVVFLGPQVRFMQKQFSKNTSVPVEVIDMQAYGTMNGAKVLDQAISILGL